MALVFLVVFLLKPSTSKGGSLQKVFHGFLPFDIWPPIKGSPHKKTHPFANAGSGEGSDMKCSDVWKPESFGRVPLASGFSVAQLFSDPGKKGNSFLGRPF